MLETPLPTDGSVLVDRVNEGEAEDRHDQREIQWLLQFDEPDSWRKAFNWLNLPRGFFHLFEWPWFRVATK